MESDWWTSSLSLLVLSDRWIFTLGTWAVHMLTFWVFNILLSICYSYSLWPERRIQKGAMPTKTLIQETLRHLLVNHLLVFPFALYYLYPLYQSFGMEVYQPIPSIWIILRDLIISMAINDTLFYWSHRLAHHPAIYQYVHKQHHRYHQSIGIASEFAHPVEDLLCNLIPTLLGCLVMGSHVVTLWLWIFIRIYETVDAHSGYCFAWSPFHAIPLFSGPTRHDFHHSANLGCFGSFTIFWDTIMGTDRDFLRAQDKQQEKEKEKEKVK
eukprot:scaffold1172_cov180-Ochromonas_danica.AAC.40